MTSHHKQQQESEYLVCNSFLNLYNNLHNTKTTFSRHGNSDKNEPDCICSDDVAIEITSTQDNSYQAEKLHSNYPVQQRVNLKLNSLENLEQIIFQKLIKLNTGKYNGVLVDVILVCVLESPLITGGDVNLFIESYTPHPQDNYLKDNFREIWLLWKSENGGDIKIKQLK